MRFGVQLGPFWVSFGGRRRPKRARRPAAGARTPAEPQVLERQERERLVEELAERRRVAAMTPVEYGRYIGMSEDEIARALFTLSAEDRQQGEAELQRLRHEMGYHD